MIEFEIVNMKTEDSAKKLIICGLSQYFVEYNYLYNPDIENILTYYNNDRATMYIAKINNEIVGTGAIIKINNDTVKFERISVKEDFRRRKIGEDILKYLEQLSISLKFKKVILETSNNWDGAIMFYLYNDYKIYKEREGNIYFQKYL